MAAAAERRTTVHGTAIAAGERAALIRGPSGSGKSDLALRCLCLAPSPLLMHHIHLIADDQVLVRRDGSRLLLSAPLPIKGQIEVRGLGIVPVENVDHAILALVVDFVSLRDALERMPEPETVMIEGIAVRRIMLHPFEASAPHKLLLALSLQH